jgi:hypothetical protein
MNDIDRWLREGGKGEPDHVPGDSPPALRLDHRHVQGRLTHGEEAALLRANAHVPKASGFVDDDGAEHAVTVCAASHPGIGPVPWPCETSRWIALYDELREAMVQNAINAVLEAT